MRHTDTELLTALEATIADMRADLSDVEKLRERIAKRHQQAQEGRAMRIRSRAGFDLDVARWSGEGGR